MIEDVANPFYSAHLPGGRAAPRSRGFMVIAGSCGEDPERERELVARAAAPPRRRAGAGARRREPRLARATRRRRSSSSTARRSAWRPTRSCSTTRAARAPRSSTCSRTATGGSPASPTRTSSSPPPSASPATGPRSPTRGSSRTRGSCGLDVRDPEHSQADRGRAARAAEEAAPDGAVHRQQPPHRRRAAGAARAQARARARRLRRLRAGRPAGHADDRGPPRLAPDGRRGGQARVRAAGRRRRPSRGGSCCRPSWSRAGPARSRLRDPARARRRHHVGQGGGVRRVAARGRARTRADAVGRAPSSTRTRCWTPRWSPPTPRSPTAPRWTPSASRAWPRPACCVDDGAPGRPLDRLARPARRRRGGADRGGAAGASPSPPACPRQRCTLAKYAWMRAHWPDARPRHALAQRRASGSCRASAASAPRSLAGVAHRLLRPPHAAGGGSRRCDWRARRRGWRPPHGPAGTPLGRAGASLAGGARARCSRSAATTTSRAAVGAGAAGEGDVLDSCGHRGGDPARDGAAGRPSASARAVAEGFTVGWHAIPGRLPAQGAVWLGRGAAGGLRRCSAWAPRRATRSRPRRSTPTRARSRCTGSTTTRSRSPASRGGASPGALYRAALERIGADGASVLARMEALAGPAAASWSPAAGRRASPPSAVKRRHLGPFEHDREIFAGARGAAMAAHCRR